MSLRRRYEPMHDEKPTRGTQGITNKLDARMMEAVRQAVEAADAVLVVVDCSVDPESVLPMVQSAPSGGSPIAVVRQRL